MSNKIEYFKSLKDMYQTEKLAKIPTQSYFNIVPLETKRVYGKFVWHKPNAYTLYNKNFNIFTKLKQGFTILGEKCPLYKLTYNSRNSYWSSWKINRKKKHNLMIQYTR